MRTQRWMRTAFAVLVAMGAVSASAEVFTLSLEKAIELARESSPQIRRYSALEEAARAGVAAAEGTRLPTIDLTAQYSRNADVPELKTIIPEQGIVTIFPNLPDKWQTQARLDMPLYTGGRITSTIDAAASSLDAATSDIVTADRSVVLETTIAFWNLVTAIERARVLTGSLSSFDQHLADAKNRVDLGFAARNEVLAVQAERQRAQLQMISARLAVESGEANLRRLTGLATGTRIEPQLSLAPSLDEPLDTEALVVEALAQRADISALRARVDAADAAADASGSSRRPQAGLFASYEYSNPNPKILPMTGEWNDTWALGVGVGWRVFDGGATKTAEAKARANANALREQLRDAEEWVRLEVTQYVLDLLNATAAEQVAHTGLEAATENERVTRDRYREGVSPSSDLLDAETLTLRAGLDVTQAASAARVARARIERAVGR